MTEAERDALLLQLVRDVAAIREAIGGRARGRATADLLRAIHCAMGGDFVFTCADVAETAMLPEFFPLRAALLAALGSTRPRRLGKALRAIVGQDLGGLMVERISEERAGVIWAVRECKPANPHCSFPAF